MSEQSASGQDKVEASDERLAKLAQRAVVAFREENDEAYQELVREFEARSANVAVFGHGRIGVAVKDGQVSVEPGLRGGGDVARGAIYPESLVAIAEGRTTPLEAHFKGDLIAQAPSGDLHRAYGYFVKFADSAVRSERLQELIKEFRVQVG
jgi:hypothetical protein